VKKQDAIKNDVNIKRMIDRVKLRPEYLNDQFPEEKDIKIAFPVLKNLEGRFFIFFLNELYSDYLRFIKISSRKAKKFAAFARENLGDKKCYNQYKRETLCNKCKYFTGEYCVQYPDMGQTWKGQGENEPASLRHPQVLGYAWYWCIRECKDFRHVDSKLP